MVKTFTYVGLTDDDNITLHEERVAIPPHLHETFKTVLTDQGTDPGNDLRTEGVIKNLLRNGAERIDGDDGTAAVKVLRFNDESSMEVYRAGGELDAHDEPLVVMEKHFKDGKPHFTVGYNHSGVPEHVSFDATNRKTQFLNNLDSDMAIREMRAIVAYEKNAPSIGFAHDYKMTA